MGIKLLRREKEEESYRGESKFGECIYPTKRAKEEAGGSWGCDTCKQEGSCTNSWIRTTQDLTVLVICCRHGIVVHVAL